MSETYGARTAGRPGGIENQDNLFADPKRGLFMVSDGLGRHRGGEAASRNIIEAVSGALKDLACCPAGEVKDRIRRAFRTAAETLNAKGQAEPDLADMCATLTLLRLESSTARIFHVGDSRAYLLRRQTFRQITRDHSLAWEQLEAGAITKDQMMAHPNQKHLTRTFNATREFVLAEDHEERVEKGDIFLLCTDGVTKVLTDQRIAKILIAEKNAEARCDALVRAAQDLGSDDDVTAVVVDVG